MAIFHLHQQVITKGQGRSIVAAAAYRSGSILSEKIIDKETGVLDVLVHDYSKKSSVIYNEIFAPSSAPDWVYDREELWNKVSETETRKDSQFAKEIDLALPVELDSEQAVELLRDFVDECFVKKGMVADVNIHWEEGNPHSHILLTTRNITKEGFGLKNRDWNSKAFLFSMRELWAEKVNLTLKRLGIDQTIDHRSFKEMSIDLQASIHEGIASKLDGYTERVEQNRVIREENARRIIDNPEIIIDIVSFKYNIFSKEEIAREAFNILEASSHYPSEEYLQPILNKIFGSELLLKVTDKSLNNEALFITSAKNKLEKDLFINVDDLKSKSDHTLVLNAFVEDPSIVDNPNNEKVKALMYITEGTNLSVLIGRAGTGKSTLIAELALSYAKEGYEIYGGAVSGIATDNLAKVCTGNKVRGQFRTIAGWKALSEQHKERSGSRLLSRKKSLFILDESSMAEIGALKFLTDLAVASGAKLVMIGDPDQLQPIGVGDGFRAIADRVGHFELGKIWRQKEQWQKDATLALANGQIREAYDKYEKNGCVDGQIETREQARSNIVHDYVSNYGKEKGKAIILTYTIAEVNLINQQVREYLKQGGLLVEVENAKYRTGQGLLELCKGEEIIFTKNNITLGIYNGTRGMVDKVSSVSKDFHGTITVRLDDKLATKVIINTAEYNHFTYGYATTIHKAQGLTVDKTYLLADKYMNHNSFYVAASRHRNEMRLYTDKETFYDKEAIIKTFGRSYNSRNLAVDYEITNDNRKYHDRVLAYKETRDNVVKLYEYISHNALEQNKSFATQKEYSLFLEKIIERNRLAKEIHSDYKHHQIYLRQAGVYKTSIEKHAGIFGSKEKSKSADIVGKYLDNIKELTILNKTINKYKAGEQSDKKYKTNTFDMELRTFEHNKTVLNSETKDLAFYLYNNKHLIRKGIDTKLLERNVEEFTARAFKQYKTAAKVAELGYTNQAIQRELSLPEMMAVINKLTSVEEKQALASLFNQTFEQLVTQKQDLTSEISKLNKELASLDNIISNSLYKRDLTIEYLAKIYKQPEEALYKWNSLIQEKNTENLITNIEAVKSLIKSDITILGELRGKEYLWIVKDSYRKRANELGQTVVNKLEKDYLADIDKNVAIATKEEMSEQNKLPILEKQLTAVKTRLAWIDENERVLKEVSNIAFRNSDQHKNVSKNGSIAKEDSVKNTFDTINHRILDKEVNHAINKLDKYKAEIGKLSAINYNIEKLCKKAFTDNDDNALPKILNRWNELIGKYGKNQAIDLVQKEPEILGTLKGQTKMFGFAEDQLRKQAREETANISKDLTLYQNNIIKTGELEYKSKSVKDTLLQLNIDKKSPKEEISEQVYVTLYKHAKFDGSMDNNLSYLKHNLKAKAGIIAGYIKHDQASNEDIKEKLGAYEKRYQIEDKSYELEIYERTNALIEKKGNKAITFKDYADVHKNALLFAKLEGRLSVKENWLPDNDIINKELQNTYKIATAISKQLIDQNNLDTTQYKLPIRDIIVEYIVDSGKKPNHAITNHIIEAARVQVDILKQIDLPTEFFRAKDIKLIDKHRTEFTKHVVSQLGYKLLEKSINKKSFNNEDIKEVTLETTKQNLLVLKEFDKEVIKVYTQKILKDFEL